MNSKRFSLGMLLFGALLLLAIAALACSSGYGGGASTKTTTSSPPASASSVTISNFSFSPSSLSVAKGTTVTWTNKDSTAHTVASDSGVFDSGNMAQNATFSYTFNSAGTFAYHCGLHPYMKATVTVQ